MGNRVYAPVADIGRPGRGTDFRQDLPAALALVARRQFGDDSDARYVFQREGIIRSIPTLNTDRGCYGYFREISSFDCRCQFF